MKVFISQPMNGKTNEEIMETRLAVKAFVEAKYGKDVEIIDSFIKDAPHEAKPVWFLGESIKKLSEADLMVQVSEEDKYPRGVQSEGFVAVQYDVPVIHIHMP